MAKRKKEKGGRVLVHVCVGCGAQTWAYKRKLNHTMAAGLAILAREIARTGRPWHHAGRLIKKRYPGAAAFPNSEFPRLRLWGLIRGPQDKAPDENPSNGFYTLSDAGVAFVRGLIEVPSHVEEVNSVCVGESNERVRFRDCLGDGFDYAEQMHADGGTVDMFDWDPA